MIKYHDGIYYVTKPKVGAGHAKHRYETEKYICDCLNSKDGIIRIEKYLDVKDDSLRSILCRILKENGLSDRVSYSIVGKYIFFMRFDD